MTSALSKVLQFVLVLVATMRQPICECHGGTLGASSEQTPARSCCHQGAPTADARNRQPVPTPCRGCGCGCADRHLVAASTRIASVDAGHTGLVLALTAPSAPIAWTVPTCRLALRIESAAVGPPARSLTLLHCTLLI